MDKLNASKPARLVERDRFAAYLGIKLVRAEPGHAIAVLEVDEKHLNGADRVQGGVIFTLADFAFAAASNERGGLTLGLQVSISYFKAPEGKVLTAEAKELTSQKKICGYGIDVFDETKALVAHCSAVGYIKA